MRFIAERCLVLALFFAPACGPGEDPNTTQSQFAAVIGDGGPASDGGGGGGGRRQRDAGNGLADGGSPTTNLPDAATVPPLPGATDAGTGGTDGGTCKCKKGHGKRGGIGACALGGAGNLGDEDNADDDNAAPGGAAADGGAGGCACRGQNAGEGGGADDDGR